MIDNDIVATTAHQLRLILDAIARGDLDASATVRARLEGAATALEGTVTLIEKCSGAVGFEAVATDHRWFATFQAAASGAGGLTQTAKGRPSGSAIRSVSRCRRGRKCAEMPLKADRTVAHARRFEVSSPVRVVGWADESSRRGCSDTATAVSTDDMSAWWAIW